MKPIKMFMLRTCPHCQRALGWMQEVSAENDEFRALEIEKIDEREHPEIASKYDYYYVPCYYIGEEKVHEGVASKEIIEAVFRKACAD